MAPMTRHAAARRVQRRIPELVIDWLERYGAEECQCGATVRFFDKAARKRLASEVGTESLRHMAKYLSTYLVEGTNGEVVTLGYRDKRIRHA